MDSLTQGRTQIRRGTDVGPPPSFFRSGVSPAIVLALGITARSSAPGRRTDRLTHRPSDTPPSHSAGGRGGAENPRTAVLRASAETRAHPYLCLFRYSHPAPLVSCAPASYCPPAEPAALSLAWVHPLGVMITNGSHASYVRVCVCLCASLCDPVMMR